MRKALAILALSLASPAFAAPTIDFTSLGLLATFNGAETDSTSLGGVGIDGFVYNGGTSFVTNEGFLWLRNNTSDHGLGYCSEQALSPGCGTTSTTGDGDRNELSNNYKYEVIRLTLPTGKVWSDVWLSSLDSGGSGSNETGTVYWSNSATPNLGTLSTNVTFSHNLIDPPGGPEVVEGSVFSLLTGLDVTAKYLFFRAGPNTAGTNNDYLVWGVNVAPIPEPESYALLLAGLGLMGFVLRGRGKARGV